MTDLISREAALECFMGLDRIGDIKDAISALPAAQVKVKSLVWEDFDGLGAKASAFYQANYLIQWWKGEGRYEVALSYPGYQTGYDGQRWHDTLNAAKAAAQADYKARILATLDLSPKPVDASQTPAPLSDPRVKALVKEKGYALDRIMELDGRAEAAEAKVAKLVDVMIWVDMELAKLSGLWHDVSPRKQIRAALAEVEGGSND